MRDHADYFKRSGRGRGRNAASLASLALVLVILAASPAAGQGVPHIALGWGVDTTGAVAWTDTGGADVVREILRRWSEYLQSNPGAQQPTKLWSAAEQERWPQYDLTAGMAYQGMPATVLEISPAAAGMGDRYVVKTLFGTVVGEAKETKPIALTRVYVVREHGQWVFSNVLPYITREWRREVVGPITYVLEPGYPFDAARARRAVAFADSLAAAYGVPQLTRLSYYLTSSPEQVHRIMGIDWTVAGIGYGYASQWNRLIFSGAPAAGEDYRHELAHFVLAPLTGAGRTHPLVNEGLATWLGGSMGRDFPTLMREYATYLRQHPEVTLDAVLEADGPDRGIRPAGAVLALMVFERGGVTAIKQLLGSGRSTDELRTALMGLLGAGWPEIGVRWREQCVAYGE